jgi:hypothetical protein
MKQASFLQFRISRLRSAILLAIWSDTQQGVTCCVCVLHVVCHSKEQNTGRGLSNRLFSYRALKFDFTISHTIRVQWWYTKMSYSLWMFSERGLGRTTNFDFDMGMSYTRVLHIKVAYLTKDVTPFTSHGRCYARA